MTTLIPKYDQGSTGASNRPINLKLAETVSVKDFGAVGDGTTNDTAAIQAAINAVPAGSTIIFPQGQYKITTTLIVTTPSLKLIGQVPYLGGTYIKAGVASLTMLQASSYGLYVNQLFFQGYETSSVYGEGTTCIGINLQNADSSGDIDSEINGCTFNQLNTCINATGRNLNVFFNLFQVSIKGVVSNQQSGQENRAIIINNNRFHVIGGVGTDSTITNATAITFTSANAFLNQINDNYADDVKFFFSGVANYGIQINNNMLQRARNTAITLNNSGQTADFASTTVIGNMIGNENASPTLSTGYGIVLNGSFGVLVSGNSINWIRQHGIWITNTANKNMIVGNYINTVNTYYTVDGTIYNGIQIDSGCISNNVTSNKISQNLAGGMQYGINNLGNSNLFFSNDFYSAWGSGTNDFNIGSTVVAYGQTNAIESQARVAYFNAAPTTGTWSRGDIVWNTQPVAGGTPGWMCVTAGTSGTWKAMASLAA